MFLHDYSEFFKSFHGFILVLPYILFHTIVVPKSAVQIKLKGPEIKLLFFIFNCH